MKRFAFLVAPFAFVLACSGASTGVDENLGESEDDLTAFKACSGKSCGESCRLCPPGAMGCFETAVLKACNAKGRCSASPPVCGGGAIDAGPAPWSPCGGKTCGDTCSICPPTDPTCFETAVLKFCHADGACSATPPACIPPPPPPPPYDPCAGKACGDSCSICPPSDPSCVETAVLKQCNAAGDCTASAAVCGAKDGGAAYSPCGGKSCGDPCTICPPGDPSCFETAVLKVCHADGACSPTFPACK